MDNVFIEAKTIVDGLAGVIVALAALIAAVIALIRVIQKLLSILKSGGRRIRLFREVTKSASFFLFILSVVGFSGVLWLRSLPKKVDNAQMSLNQSIAMRALASFEKGETNFFATGQIDRGAFMLAITNADSLIGNWSGMASNQQQALVNANEPLPPTGHVTLDQKNAIVAQGLINDVGTCYFIKGRSLEYLGQADLARTAYRVTTNYPYARTWDPRRDGFFWSPAEASLGRLGQMGRH